MSRSKGTLPLPGTYDPLPGHLVSELVALGYKAESVDHWTVEKARLVLRRYSIQANAAVRRAKRTGEAIDAEQAAAAAVIPGGPIGVLRLDAAREIRRSLDQDDLGDLLFAVQGGIGELADCELTRFAALIEKKLLGEPV